MVEWANALGFPARRGQLETDIRQARSELERQVEEQRRELAEYQVAVMDLTSSRPIEEAPQSDDASSRRQAHA